MESYEFDYGKIWNYECFWPGQKRPLSPYLTTIGYHFTLVDRINSKLSAITCLIWWDLGLCNKHNSNLKWNEIRSQSHSWSLILYWFDILRKINKCIILCCLKEWKKSILLWKSFDFSTQKRITVVCFHDFLWIMLCNYV